MTERYNRQERIKGWNQEKLTNARVAVIGGDDLSAFIVMGLAAIGIGEIRIITNSNIEDKSVLFNKLKNNVDYKGNETAKMFVTLSQKINADISIIDIHANMVNKQSLVLLNNPQVVIDATNSLTSKQLCYEYSKETKSLFISGTATADSAVCTIIRKQEDIAVFAEGEQGTIPSEVIAGVIIDETRKYLMPINSEPLIEKPIYFNIKGERFAKSN